MGIAQGFYHIPAVDIPVASTCWCHLISLNPLAYHHPPHFHHHPLLNLHHLHHVNSSVVATIAKLSSFVAILVVVSA